MNRAANGALRELLDGEGAQVVAYLDDVATRRDELDRLADALASSLRAATLGGRAVGIRMPNVPATIAAWFGVWRAGASVVPLNPRAPRAEVERLVDAVGLAAIVTDAPAGEGYRVERQQPASERLSGDGEAIVQLTSGTTGPPKPVVLRHAVVLELLDSVIASLRGGRVAAPQPMVAAPQPMPNLVPMSLALWGGIYQVLFALRLGAPAVLMQRFEPVEFARLVDRYAIRSSVLPPAALLMLLDEPAVGTLAPLRYVRSVSAPLSPVHARRFHERFGVAVLNGYGQTELGGESIGWTASDWKRFGTEKLGSVGRPHAAFSLRIRTPSGGVPTVDGVGELEVRSETRAGNLGDPDLAERTTDDGWLRTGDVARIDRDGFVWIEGRMSTMINRGGLKVFPDEVEECAREVPEVADCAVVGVADDRLGEVPWAFVVARSGRRVDGDDLRARWRDALAPYKVPAGVTLVDELPRNEAGKVLRHELVDRLVRPATPGTASGA